MPYMISTRWKIAQWFELHWWKNYLRGKNKVEYLKWKKNYWQNILFKISEVLKTSEISTSKTICDLGCGPAGVFIALPENKVTAVDPLIDEYEKQTPFFSKSDYPNVTFVKSTLEEFEVSTNNVIASEVLRTARPDFLSGKQSPARSGIASQNLAMTFDVVFCMNCINHVYEIEKGFEKLKEVCANTGTLILSIDAHNFSFFKYLFRLVPGDILHPQQYDLHEYKTFLENQGFKILKLEVLKSEFFFTHYLIIASES